MAGVLFHLGTVALGFLLQPPFVWPITCEEDGRTRQSFSACPSSERLSAIHAEPMSRKQDKYGQPHHKKDLDYAAMARELESDGTGRHITTTTCARSLKSRIASASHNTIHGMRRNEETRTRDLITHVSETVWGPPKRRTNREHGGPNLWPCKARVGGDSMTLALIAAKEPGFGVLCIRPTRSGAPVPSHPKQPVEPILVQMLGRIWQNPRPPPPGFGSVCPPAPLARPTTTFPKS